MPPVATFETYHAEPFGHSKMLIRNKQSVFSSADKVTLIRSSLFSGINKYSNKRWYRWQTQHVDGLRRNNNGTIIPFTGVYKKGGMQFIFNRYSTPFELLNEAVLTHDVGATGMFRAHVQHKLGVSSLTDVYPMAEAFGIDRYNAIPQLLVGHFRQLTGQDFTRSVFGAKNYRRDLVRATCSATPVVVAVAKEFRNLVPIDWIIGFMRNNDIESVDSFINLRKILLQIDPRSYRHLLRDNDVNLIRYATDVSRFVRHGRVQEPVLVRSFRELHDTLFGGTRPLRIVEDEPVKLIGVAKQLEGLIVDDLTFVPATNTSQLVQWSNKMSNCISAYAGEATRGSGIYAAVERDGKVIANLEIVNNKLKQLLGKYNQSLNEDLKASIVAVLNEKNVDTSGNWWGNNE